MGITKVESHYILAVYTSKDSKIHVYKSNDKSLDDPGLSFGEEVFSFGVSFSGKGVGYDNLNLYADKSGAVYMIGMRGESSGSSFADYMELIAIDTAQETYSVLRSRHMATENHQGITGPHFRYGAGTVLVGPILNLKQYVWLFCSGRLFMAFPTKTQMNFFAKVEMGPVPPRRSKRLARLHQKGRRKASPSLIDLIQWTAPEGRAAPQGTDGEELSWKDEGRTRLCPISQRRNVRIRSRLARPVRTLRTAAGGARFRRWAKESSSLQC